MFPVSNLYIYEKLVCYIKLLINACQTVSFPDNVLFLFVCVFFFVFLFLLGVPKFPKEEINPLVVKEGEPVVLKCNPPAGVPPRQIYWMSIGKSRSSCLCL